jgi:hypothetical protein
MWLLRENKDRIRDTFFSRMSYLDKMIGIPFTEGINTKVSF